MTSRVRISKIADIPEVQIDAALVRRIVAAQFPQWATLSVEPLSSQGWSNRVFRLGPELVVRLPRLAAYAPAIQRECSWLPRLGPNLPIPIAQPIARGVPCADFVHHWSVLRWLPGESASATDVNSLSEFAQDLARFLVAMQRIDTSGGPAPGPDNFHRGGALAVYYHQVQDALDRLGGEIDVGAAREVWCGAEERPFRSAPVWLHGDVSLGNLLVDKGRLCGVIDFGNLAVGDPACDLVIAWNVLNPESREVFRETLACDDAMWARGRAWALWKALIVLAGVSQTNARELSDPRRIIDAIFRDYRAL